MSRAVLYFNPSSGRKTANLQSDVRVAARQVDVEMVRVDESLDIARDVGERIAGGQKLFIAAGGDGTINHVIQSMMNTDASLGVLPFGTFNHFARDIGIPLDWREALRVALAGAERQIDAGRVNDRYFLNNVSLGLYPEIVKLREEFRAAHGKWVAYPVATWLALKTFSHVSIILESPPLYEAIKTHLFFVSANPYELSHTGVLAPRKSFVGGKLTVYWLPRTSKLRVIRLLSRYFRGRLSSGEQFRLMQTPELKIHATDPELRMGMDGELFRFKTPLGIQIIPRALLVRVPNNGEP